MTDPKLWPETLVKLRQDAMAIFKAGLTAVDSKAAVLRACRRNEDQFIIGDCHYQLSDFNRIFVIGAGKATASMALAMEELLGENIFAGSINVKYGHDVTLERIQQVAAGHPIPDRNGVAGAEKILAMVSGAGAKDLVVGLISGGGSALLALPAPGVSLADKQKTTQMLLGCGATIHEINTVRKHLSQAKGGLLAKAAYPATVVNLILSDVVGDDLDVIASGPMVPDASAFEECLDIITSYDLFNHLPESVIKRVQDGKAGRIDETPKPGNHIFKNVRNWIIGSNADALAAARVCAEMKGYNTLILSSMIEGEACEAAKMHTAIIREVLKTGNPLPTPACILSGGETTVQIKGSGTGGRNQEFALAAAMAIDGCDHSLVLSVGTDGTDGPTDAAGAVADSTTVSRARQIGIEPKNYLADNDAYHFFQQLDDLIITGPTHTNVMDLRVLLVC